MIEEIAIIRRKLLETLALMADDWSDQENNNADRCMMESKAKTSDRITKAIMILHTIAVATYCTEILIADVDLTDPTIEIPYINKLVLPFHTNTQLTYRLVMVVQYVHMLMSNWVAGIANIVLLTMVSRSCVKPVSYEGLEGN